MKETISNAYNSFSLEKFQPHIKADSVPCQVCHKQVYEIHGSQALIQIANGSIEGRSYIHELVAFRKKQRLVLGGNSRLSKHRSYKEMRDHLKHCGCDSGKPDAGVGTNS